MASLSKRSTGSYTIQFEDRDNIRKTISVGNIPKRDAEAIRRHVEALVHAQIAGTSPDAATSRWVANAGEKLSKKLAKVGLVLERKSGTLGSFIDSFTMARESDPNIKPSTIAASEPTHKNLKEHFGANKPLRSITRGDAKSWRLQVAKGRADNTVRKWTANAKKLFNSAIDHELIDTNPFNGLASSTTEVRTREYFVTMAEAVKVLEACPSLEWRMIFALCRFGGLRCPSEVLALRWGDVLWDKQRFVVRSIKTEHHEGHETRVVPLFPELEPLLREGFDAADEGAEYVINRTRDSSTNLRTQMKRIIERSGIKPWPKLFQNLRATRATELADKFPSHVAAAWCGHSVKVAKESYWQVTDDHFDAALSKSAANALQTLQDIGRLEGSQENVKCIMSGIDAIGPILSMIQVGDEGLEPPTSSV